MLYTIYGYPKRPEYIKQEVHLQIWPLKYLRFFLTQILRTWIFNWALRSVNWAPWDLIREDLTNMAVDGSVDMHKHELSFQIHISFWLYVVSL